MSTPAKSGRGRTARAQGGSAAKTKAKRTAETAAQATAQAKDTAAQAAPEAGHGHDVTITIPVDRIAGATVKAISVPVVLAQRVLPAKGGLPLYLGLGALGVAGALEWPVAVGIGAGYAVLRRGGALDPGRARRQPAPAAA